MSRDRQEQRLHIRDVCGKQEETANLQGLLSPVSKGIAVYGERLKGFGGLDKETGLFVAKGLFSTITNVN
jgi:hydroxylamine reductase